MQTKLLTTTISTQTRNYLKAAPMLPRPPTMEPAVSDAFPSLVSAEVMASKPAVAPIIENIVEDVVGSSFCTANPYITNPMPAPNTSPITISFAAINITVG